MKKQDKRQPGRPRIPLSTEQLILRLRAAGMTFHQISLETGVSIGSAHAVVTDAGSRSRTSRYARRQRPELPEAVRRLRSKGKTYRQIALALGISASTAHSRGAAL